jgi:hypothetical protein
VSGRDVRIGRNLAQWRGQRTQVALADEMRARGWKWSQATVWAVEKGERPLRLAEAADLTVILSEGGPARSPMHLLMTEAELNLTRTLDASYEADDQVLTAAKNWSERRGALAEAALAARTEVGQSTGSLNRDLWEGVYAQLTTSPADLIREWSGEWTDGSDGNPMRFASVMEYLDSFFAEVGIPQPPAEPEPFPTLTVPSEPRPSHG